MINFNISIDKFDLSTKIICSDINSHVFRLIRLNLSSITDELKYINSGLEIPWYLFRQQLRDFSQIVKREHASVEFSSFAEEMIIDFLDDKKKSNEINYSSQFQSTELNQLLDESGFLRKLTDEQIQNVLKLLALKHGANFSVPGAGKTATLLALHTFLQMRELVNLLFVIAPMNAFISWEEEVRDIFSPEKVKIYRISSSDILNSQDILNIDAKIFLINYEKLRGDIRNLFLLFENNQVHLVLDESHRIKAGERNLSFQQIIKLSDISKRRDILSGTPMPQSYHDLDAQFYFLWRDISFLSTSINLDEREKFIQINKKISSKYVRTTKSELGLKDPKIKYTYINLGPIQTDLYNLLKSEFARNISGIDQRSKILFRDFGQSVIRLIEVASNPILLGVMEYPEGVTEIPFGKRFEEILFEYGKYEKPAKIEMLKHRVGEILNHNSQNKVVVWTSFTRNIELLESIFKEFVPVSIYGDIPTGDDNDEKFREARIKKFNNDPTCRILIANPQACGEGISLHKACNYAIYLDRTFNAAYYLQSIDRIHRLGLDKKVETNIEILIARNTIDEILIKRLNEKSIAMGKVLNDPYLSVIAYDPSDIPQDEVYGLDSLDITAIEKHIMEINE
jgi:SNF2 family DNA or RNA helicase